jgi:hypothetical protein
MEPIDKMINECGLTCVICGAPKGECDCWTKCECGWSYRKGLTCANPMHEVMEI